MKKDMKEMKEYFSKCMRVKCPSNKKGERGAVTLATLLAGPTMNIQTVIASADGDTTATCPHLLGAAPLFVALTQMLSQALTALSAWAAGTVDATNVVGTKLTSTGSGSASVQLRVAAWIPHTAVR